MTFDANLAELEQFRSKITFFVGDNGSGKSSNLGLLANQARARNQPVIGLSNTFYDRIPRMTGSYGQLAGKFRRNLPSQALRDALLADTDRREQNLERIGKILDYLGFRNEIGIALPESALRTYARFSSDLYASELKQVERMFKSQPNGIIWMSSSNSGYERASLNILSLLHKQHNVPLARRLIQFDFYLRKGRHIVPLDNASSGELTLLTTYTFIATNITEQTLLLIDEPENSLHPKWQHEYCVRLLDMFYLYSPQIVIATHSPVIVSGAQASELKIKILEVRGRELTPLRVTSSIEETLYESFQTLSPSNHFLSEQVARLLDALNRGELSEAEFEEHIEEFEQRSYDTAQLKLLDSVRVLGRTVIGALQGKA